MKVRLATPVDDELLKGIVMHPDVWKHNACDGAKPFEPALYTAHSHSFAVLVHDAEGAAMGAFLAYCLEDRSYAVHTNLLPQCRGARAIRAGVAALEFAFVQSDAETLWSMVPEHNAAARWFARTMGFRDCFTMQAAWRHEGALWAMHHVRLDIDDWIQRQPLVEFGRAFHGVLEKFGHHVQHADDDTHDAYVGAAWAMVACGRLEKAVRIYGRWGRAANYQPFSVVSREPLVLDIGDCLVEISDEGIVAVREYQKEAA